ncbi:hypothetical protein D3C75_660580 [compost metagenome]
MEVGIGVEEVLGDGRIGTGVDLGLEVLQVEQGVLRLRMRFRIRAHFDTEGIAVLGADEGDQFGGVAHVAGETHARRQIAAQRDQAPAADGAVQLEQLADLLAGATHAGQMRCRIEAVVLVEMAHGLGGVAEGRATGAEGTGHVLRGICLQLGRGTVQLGALFVGLGRIELEADGGHGTDGGGGCG